MKNQIYVHVYTYVYFLTNVFIVVIFKCTYLTFYFAYAIVKLFAMFFSLKY